MSEAIQSNQSTAGEQPSSDRHLLRDLDLLFQGLIKCESRCHFGTKCRFERVQANTEGGFAYIAFHRLTVGTASFRDHVVGVIYYDAGQIRLVNFQVGLGRQVLLLGYSKKAQHNSVMYPIYMPRHATQAQINKYI